MANRVLETEDIAELERGTTETDAAITPGCWSTIVCT